jgi:hypothetical protein
MKRNKTSISKASSYLKIGEYWDSHDLSEIWEKNKPVKVIVDLGNGRSYIPVSGEVVRRLRAVAKRKHRSSYVIANQALARVLDA